MHKPHVFGITGAGGLIGWHTLVRLHSMNAQARFAGKPEPVAWKVAHKATFDSPEALSAFVSGCDTILHFAGVNRGPAEDVENGNIRASLQLVQALERGHSTANLVYSNSTHAGAENPYGRGKSGAAEVLTSWAHAAGTHFLDLVLPHVFGEHTRPYYNSVTATLCQLLVNGENPEINPDGKVELVHAGLVAERAIEAGIHSQEGVERMEGQALSVPNLYERLKHLHDLYQSKIIPDLSDPLSLQLFNTYRSYLPADARQVTVPINSDDRGHLFEIVKGGGGGQTFVSWTKPGVTRGNHYHLNKVERFFVLQGEATIRLRRMLHPEVQEYKVSGTNPSYVDIPTLHTHSIENTGEEPLITAFWAHEVFDPSEPDTFAETV